METGYQHGSDMLVGIVTGENTFTPLGHSKTCTITNSAETKERAVKPTLTEKAKADNPGMWKEKSVLVPKVLSFMVMNWGTTNCLSCGKQAKL